MVPRRLLILLLLALCACGRSQPPPLAGVTPALRLSAAPTEAALAGMPRYHLSLTARPQESSLTGRATISYVNPAPAELRELYLRLYPNMGMYRGRLQVHRAAVDGHDVPFVLAARDVDLRVPLPRTLPPGRAAVVEIDFSLRYPDLANDYDFFGAGDGVAVLPDFYPMVAPLINGEWRLDASPGFGDASFSPVCLYQVTLTLPAGYQAFLPGLLATERGDAVTVSAGGIGRSLALVIAEDYLVQELRQGEVTLIAVSDEQGRTAARAALGHAAAALAYFEERLGPYPGTTLLLAQAPLGASAQYASGMLLLGAGLYGEAQADLERAVVEGVARQWWGFHVGNDPLRDPWIDEAAAIYTAHLYLRHTHGPRFGEEQRLAWQEQHRIAVTNGWDGPLARPLSTYANSSRYRMLVGAKGPLFWAALEDLLGQQGVLTIMRQLQRQHGFGVLDTAGLGAAIGRLAGPPGTAVLDQWVLGAE